MQGRTRTFHTLISLHYHYTPTRQKFEKLKYINLQTVFRH